MKNEFLLMALYKLRFFLPICFLISSITILGQSSDTVSAGLSHTLSVNDDGTLWAWGDNSKGQLGIGNNTNSFIPVAVGSENNWSSVSARENYSIGIKKDGTLWAWGDNSEGQLGNGTKDDKNLPVQVGNDNDWLSVSCGDNHVIALKNNNSLWVWGNNEWGKLGLGNTINKTTPTQLGTDTNWEYISTSSQSSFAIKTDGTLWSWGKNPHDTGVLGYATSFDTNPNPKQVGTDINWEKIEAGSSHVLAIKTNGTLWGWGTNNYGQLGNKTYDYEKAPIQIGDETNWKKVKCGYFHSFALKLDGTLWTWGNSGFGQTHPDIVSNSNIPILFDTKTSWLTISGGATHSIAKKTDGSLFTWGNNYKGQLGIELYNGDISNPIPLAHTNGWTKIATGSYHTIALDSDNRLVRFGYDNSLYLFFISTKNSFDLPIIINQEIDWKRISTGSNFNTVIKTDGTLWAWGNNQKGQLGNGNHGASATKHLPVQITTEMNWSKVDGGKGFTMAIKENGTLWAWGEGKLGNGTHESSYTPIKIGTDNDWIDISCGKEHVLALKSDGTLWAWGMNNQGSLGDNTMFTNRLTPKQVGTDNNWLSISSGEVHSFAIKTNGTLWSWGANNSGQLGYSGLRSLIPKKVGTDNNWLKVATSKFGQFTLAIKTNGTLWAWGNNQFGQLGNGTFISSSIPTQIGMDNDWKEIATGSSHSFALKTNGTAWAWGNNEYGQLGLRNTISKIVTNTLTIDEYDIKNKKIVVYPNPSSDYLIIINYKKFIDIKFFSAQGTRMNISFKDNKIDIRSFPKGIYFLTLKNNTKEQQTFKILKN